MIGHHSPPVAVRLNFAHPLMLIYDSAISQPSSIQCFFPSKSRRMAGLMEGDKRWRSLEIKRTHLSLILLLFFPLLFLVDETVLKEKKKKLNRLGSQGENGRRFDPINISICRIKTRKIYQTYHDQSHYIEQTKTKKVTESYLNIYIYTHRYRERKWK